MGVVAEKLLCHIILSILVITATFFLSLSQDLQPLSLSFDLPVSMVPQTLPDAGSPLIQQVVQTLGVNVSFRAVPPHPQAQPSFYESCCTVWGLQGNATAVKVSG